MRYALIVTTTLNDAQSSGWRHLPSHITQNDAIAEAKRMSALPHVDYVHVETNDGSGVAVTATFLNGEPVA